MEDDSTFLNITFAALIGATALTGMNYRWIAKKLGFGHSAYQAVAIASCRIHVDSLLVAAEAYRNEGRPLMMQFYLREAEAYGEIAGFDARERAGQIRRGYLRLY